RPHKRNYFPRCSSNRRNRASLDLDNLHNSDFSGGPMRKFSRRDILKTSVLASAAATVHELAPIAAAMEIGPDAAGPFFALPVRDTNNESLKGAGRERLLLDFGWRFHFGHAHDPAKDFGFTGNF